MTAAAVTQLDDDMLRERRINAAFRRMCVAETSDDKRRWWGEMEAEILERSAEQVVRMERARGLR